MRLATAAVFLLVAGGLLDISAQTRQSGKWKTFRNRAGWSIRYPKGWSVASCHQCDDPGDDNAFVAISDPRKDGMIMIDHFVDKPADQGIEQWLGDLKRTVNLNERVSEESVILDGEKALRVITRNLDATENETVYVVHDSKTFGIMIDRNSNLELSRRIVSTFHFEKRPR